MKKCLVMLIAACLVFSGVAQASEAPLKVTAVFYPLYVATINVARDVPGLDIVCLAPPSAGCLHDYQMSTADRRVLEDSDVVIINGAGLETFLDKLLPQLPAQIIVASEGIELLTDEHGPNAHVWVSVPGMMAEVQNIADGLAKAAPDHAGKFQQNAASYIEELSVLEADMKATLAPYAGAPIVTFHEAFAYFAEDFDLDVVATVQHEHDMAPSGRDLAITADAIREHDVKALFAEPQYEDTSVDILAKETGVPVFLLDPAVSGEVDPEDYGAYIRTMRQNMNTLVEALQ